MPRTHRRLLFPPFLPLLLFLPLHGSCGVPSYPDGAFSCPPVDRWDCFETVSGVQPAGNPVQRLAQWERNDLRAVQRGGQPWTRWRFICRPGNGAVLCFHDRFRRMPQAVTVRVANAGTRPVSLAVSLSEVPWLPDPKVQWRNWAVGGDAPVPAGAERTVRFDLAHLAPDRPVATAGATPAWPTAVNLHVGGPEAGVEYVLDLREWTVSYPAAPGVAVSRLTAPDDVAPGAVARFEVEARGVRAGAAVDLELREEPRVLWRIRLSASEARALSDRGRVALRRATPWYLPERALTAVVVVDGYRAAGATARVRVHNPAHSGFPRVERRQHNGRPTLFINGRPATWSGYSSYEYQPGNVTEFGASGVNMFVVPVAAGRHVHQISATTWPAPDRYDFSQVDERVCMSLQANPQAMLVLRVSLALPVFWLQAHPESIALVRTAEGNGPGETVAWEETGCLAASLASEQWRAQQEACLGALIAHCAAQPWASHVAGFHPTGEVTEEWFAWGCNDGLYADYSPATQAAWAAWCGRQGYPWRSVPLPRERQRPGWDYFPGDEAGRQAATYSRWQNELTSDIVARFCRVIKEATGGRCLAGAFHSYLVQLAGEPRQSISGQFGVRRLLDCPDFDFFAGVPLLNYRDLTHGYDANGSATESILAAGKLLVNENDMFSWLHHALWHVLYDPADPRAGVISMHRRVLADDMVHGAQRGWFSLLASWHHDAGLQAEFAREVALQATSPRYDRRGTEEVAQAVDDSSFNWMTPGSTLPGATHPGLLYALGRTGAPVGVWLLRDLDRLPARIKMVVIAEATAALPEDLRKLAALLREGGRTVVVLGAPGLIDPQKLRWDLTAPGALLGLPLRVNEAGGPGVAFLSPTGEAVCGIPQVRPRTEGSGAGQSWLRFSDGAAAGLERELPRGGRLIWCSVPPQVSDVPRAWMERAGVHCYAPLGFSVHASQGLVAVTAPALGEATLSWPGPVRVQDLFDGWSAQGVSFPCPFAAGQTRLFAVSAQ